MGDDKTEPYACRCHCLTQSYYFYVEKEKATDRRNFSFGNLVLQITHLHWSTFPSANLCAITHTCGSAFIFIFGPIVWALSCHLFSFMPILNNILYFFIRQKKGIKQRFSMKGKKKRKTSINFILFFK